MMFKDIRHGACKLKQFRIIVDFIFFFFFFFLYYSHTHTYIDFTQFIVNNVVCVPHIHIDLWVEWFFKYMVKETNNKKHETERMRKVNGNRQNGMQISNFKMEMHLSWYWIGEIELDRTWLKKIEIWLKHTNPFTLIHFLLHFCFFLLLSSSRAHNQFHHHFISLHFM